MTALTTTDSDSDSGSDSDNESDSGDSDSDSDSGDSGSDTMTFSFSIPDWHSRDVSAELSWFWQIWRWIPLRKPLELWEENLNLV